MVVIRTRSGYKNENGGYRDENGGFGYFALEGRRERMEAGRVLLLLVAGLVGSTTAAPVPLPAVFGTTNELVKTNFIPLRDTLLRLDSLLRRPNDYNEVIEESGEEDDQLSRVLYEIQNSPPDSNTRQITDILTSLASEDSILKRLPREAKRGRGRSRERRPKSKERRCKPRGSRSRERSRRPSRERRPRPSRERYRQVECTAASKDLRSGEVISQCILEIRVLQDTMAEWRGTAAVLLVMSLASVPPARPRPNPSFILPHQARDIATTTPSPDGWSLKDTIARMDELLQRHNDYNDVMLESGEEDDQLSRLLYKLQHGDRVREGWYDEPTPPDLGLDEPTTTTRRHSRRARRQRRGSGGRRGKKKHRGKSWERRCNDGKPSHRSGKHHSREKHKHRSQEKHKHHSRERCITEEDTSTTTTAFPTTTAAMSTQIPFKPNSTPLTSTTSPVEGGGGDGGIDASLSYEDDAEFLPFY
ncbi:hypothetical protein O3P69_007542 [Scylla paramamosain]|uniref:Uncharacterized protein n=1 Tax=Scylla paramamosain TaxID=85552 RepID=A0AAW0V056_SCYPA